MPGYVRRRGKRFVVALDLPRGEDGKRRQLFLSGFRTQRQAKDRLLEVLHDIKRGVLIDGPSMPLTSLLERWLKHVKNRVSARSSARYAEIVTLYINPTLGTIPLNKLRGPVIQSLYDELLSTGRTRGGGGLSPRSVQYTHRTLHSAMQFALRQELIGRNPCLSAQPPTVIRREFQALDEAGLIKLVAAARDTPLRSLIFLAGMSGLRRNELLALPWASVDLASGTISVHRSMEKCPTGEVRFKAPKTHRSRRLVALPTLAMELLRSVKVEQAAQKLALGPNYRNEHDLVFTDSFGAPLKPDTVSKAFSRLVRSLGYSKLRLHDLRHTAATIMLRQGVHPKIVSEMMGHSSVAMTLDTYSHVVPTMQESAAAKMDAALRLAMRKSQSG